MSKLGRSAWVLDAPRHLWHAGSVVAETPGELEVASHCGKRLAGGMLNLIWAASFDYNHFEQRGLICAACAKGENR